jgi:phenylalanyl-tRNA synthetase beta chain
MKISRNWLQTYFDQKLPEAQTLADAITFHAFEIEGVVKAENDDVLDVKVTANRGHDCLCHRGIAKEISAILNMPIKEDPLRATFSSTPATEVVAVEMEDEKLCPRYMAAYIKNVKVGPSPDWLRERLEAIGQKSINNIVDAANFVMFNIGQPLHAFDAGKLSLDGAQQYKIAVRNARDGEKITALDGKEYQLTNAMLLIVDGNADRPLGIAGVKGGTFASVNEATTDLIIEAANFNGVSLRRTAQALKFRTDASTRFEQGISPELAVYGMGAVVDLILQVAGGELVGCTDRYLAQPEPVSVQISTARINATLGSSLANDEIVDAFRRLDLSHVEKGENFVVRVPFERLDITIPEDLVEEVGRIVGYDKIPSTPLPSFPKEPEINANFYASEQVREDLIEKEYSEVYTSVFADKGERVVLNKVDGVRPYLRANLTEGLSDALTKNVRNKDLLGIGDVKLFEIGSVWNNGKEEIIVGTIGEKEKAEQKKIRAEGKSNQYENLPLSQATRYESFSKYPFVVRDVAMWTPRGTNNNDVLALIKQTAGPLLVRSSLFDTFEKGDKVSLAFRLVFQSFDRTLTDSEVNEIMEKVYAALKEKAFEIR